MFSAICVTLCLVLHRPRFINNNVGRVNLALSSEYQILNPFEVSLRLNSYHAWFNNSLDWWFPGETVVQSELTDIFGLTFIMSLPISPLPGAVVDFFAGKYRSDGQVWGSTRIFRFIWFFKNRSRSRLMIPVRVERTKNWCRSCVCLM